MVSGPACENRKMTDDLIAAGIEKDRAVVGEDEDLKRLQSVERKRNRYGLFSFRSVVCRRNGSSKFFPLSFPSAGTYS